MLTHEQFEASSYLSSQQADYIAELYAQYLKTPANVDASWHPLFAQIQTSAGDLNRDLSGASWSPRQRFMLAQASGGAKVEPATAPANAIGGGALSEAQVRAATLDSVRALMMIRVYRVRGHLEAKLDPLSIAPREPHPELDPQSYGFGPADLDRPIFLDHVLGFEYASVRQILERVRETYCGSVGVEFMHIQDPAQKSWIQEKFESGFIRQPLSQTEQARVLKHLVQAEGLENFLHTKFQGTKRFGLDGAESMIPAIEMMITRSRQLGVEEIVLGMAHRGRLNVLTNVLHKHYAELLSEFLKGGVALPSDMEVSGDVKYHLGASADRKTVDGDTIHLSLTANPSHLEAVNPVVLGKVRAKQDYKKDQTRSKVVGLLIHGDAAFAGQGLVAETMLLSQLDGYKTGGTLHFIINNQIGFTTNPTAARSSPYSSDVAKMVQAPILHVNGEDVEALVRVVQLAAEYRHTFKADIVVDMFCYRKYGHNESDEPMFTQPLMYAAIAKKIPVAKQYADQLIAMRRLTTNEVTAIQDRFKADMDAAFEAAKTYQSNKPFWLEGLWKQMKPAKADDASIVVTGVDEAKLKKVGATLVHVPPGFNANKKIVRQLELKKASLDQGSEIDWATAEALAFGTLLLDNYGVRLSGQDCGRGTFSQRHAVLHDQSTNAEYIPLQHIDTNQARFEVTNSPLSEAAVMGFDYGYSLANPNTLVLWEGQFGDFANGAQVMIDQFIAAAESKWLRMSGLVLLLPHGYEGQGPEHSSARLERFLQLCAENNMIVANCSTPASYFHILRRQMVRTYRKPLVLMTPKSLLRHKLCVSSLADLSSHTAFQPVLPEIDSLAADRSIKRVVLCSGKVYFDLLEARRAQKIKDIAIVRVEQLYPFPQAELMSVLKPYSQAETVWCQEEPMNMGAWHFIDRRLEQVLVALKRKSSRPIYVGRDEAASPATGNYHVHAHEQELLVKQALGLD